jgi:hypothetical protein
MKIRWEETRLTEQTLSISSMLFRLTETNCLRWSVRGFSQRRGARLTETNCLRWSVLGLSRHRGARPTEGIFLLFWVRGIFRNAVFFLPPSWSCISDTYNDQDVI